MLNRALEHIVLFSHRNAWLVIAVALCLTILCGWYARGHVQMDTDQSHMISPKLDWRQREIRFGKEFPQQDDQLVVVVDAGTPDEAEAATRTLTAALQQPHREFKSVHRPDGGPYFIKYGLMLLPVDQVKSILDLTIKAQPLLGTLAADPSPRGLFGAISLLSQGVSMGEAQLSAVDPALQAVDAAVKSVLDGHPRPLAWQALLSGRTPGPGDLQHVILVEPVLDYGALQPGGKASDVIRRVAAENGLSGGDVRVRITGNVALSDEEFQSAAQGAAVATAGSMLLVVVWLSLALKSLRLILAILGTLIVGFVITGGFAALTVGTLNLISIAFAVLFIGLAVDFSIQFSVRYRAERFQAATLGEALGAMARSIGTPVAVAALATAAGFYSFLPTAFKGVSELGLIAGTGMLIAFTCNITVLPALLTLVRPKPEHEPVGYRWAAPVDRFLKRNRRAVVGIAALVGLAGAVMLPGLHFDFDPLHLKNQKAESVQTLYALTSDPLSPPYDAEVLEPDVASAAREADALSKLPEVAMAVSLDSFVPDDQETKLALISDAALLMLPTLTPPQVAPPPSIAEIRASMTACRTALEAAVAKAGTDVTVSAFIADLKVLEAADDRTIAQLQPILISSLPDRLDDLRQLLNAGPVTLDTIPPDIRRDWVSADGTARVEVFPKGDFRKNAVLRAFFKAMQKAAPEASGSAIGIQQSSATIVHAFKTAGISAIVVIALLLAAALRNFADVAMVLAPLLLSCFMTVIFCVAWPYPINFANIIALPLLLGIGVAFDIYFVMNWRNGQGQPLQSPTARAVLFSALTTGTAFGSLALSHHPGTASMGVLLIVSLCGTLVCTLIVLPAMLEAFRGKASSHEDVAH